MSKEIYYLADGSFGVRSALKVPFYVSGCDALSFPNSDRSYWQRP
ncbi:hypothetical protein [Chroococcidiopsis sp. CCMEE 29]|nr:hypothetical protein [Chroococcidiopsis sp. CCMEE 29]